MPTIHAFPEFPMRRRMRMASALKCFAVRDAGDGGGSGDGGEVSKAHGWRPIEDMPAQFDDKARRAEGELRMMSGVWREQKNEFGEQELEKFNRELNRRWAIETGLIERAYHLDRGTTEVLIERGFVEALIPRHNGQDPTTVAAMLRDHENVVNALFDFVTRRRELSVGYVKELHAEMLRNQKTVRGVDQFGKVTRLPMKHGAYKTRPNNPHTPEGLLHEYCPPEQTESEMDRLIEMHQTHSARFSDFPLARAAWLHHRFAQIHPFEDGNGRIARCLATLVFIRADMFPLVVMNEKRDDYLDALQAADNGDLSPLICRFAEWQKRHFVKALGIAGQVWDDARHEKIGVVYAMREEPGDSSLDARIDALASFVARKGRQQQIALAEQHNTAITTAKSLHGLACERLEKTAAQIGEKFGDSGEAWADWPQGEDDKGHYYRHQIVETAKKLEYYANTDVHRAWARLVLQVADERAMLLLFFHGIGRPYRGVLACAACFVMRRRVDGDENEREGNAAGQFGGWKASQWREQESVPLGNVFQINYQEEKAQAAKRFELWLDEVIQAALARAQDEF